jgi:hypothetical protein
MKSTPEFEGFLDVLQTMIHEIWAIRNGVDRDPDDNDIRELAKFAEPGVLGSWLEQIEEIRGSLAVNINKKIASDALLVHMATG